MLDVNEKSAPRRSNRSSLLARLEGEIGYRFKERRLLFEALIHRSYAMASRRRGIPDNQRLEFFGDSVLGFVVSDMLLERYPQCGEGELSRRRASLVDTMTLAGFAERIGLGTYLLLSRGEEKTGGRIKKTVLASAFEAVLGAMYLDGGPKPVATFLEQAYGALLDDEESGIDTKDYKTQLQELAHSLHCSPPVYFLNDVNGPDHNLCFTVTVMVGNECFARGHGKTRKDAEQQAAKAGFDLLAEDISRG